LSNFPLRSTPYNKGAGDKVPLARNGYLSAPLTSPTTFLQTDQDNTKSHPRNITLHCQDRFAAARCASFGRSQHVQFGECALNVRWISIECLVDDGRDAGIAGGNQPVASLLPRWVAPSRTLGRPKSKARPACFSRHDEPAALFVYALIGTGVVQRVAGRMISG